MITSYAANFQDVVLWRPFRTVRQGVFIEIDSAGFADSSIGRAFTDLGWKGVRMEWPQAASASGVASLDGLFAGLKNSKINWMRMAVEGAEGDVLKSWKTSPARPLIVLVQGGSVVPSSGKWEDELTARGYDLVRDDGRDRFYLHSTHRDLAQALKAPLLEQNDFVLDRDVALAKLFNRGVRDALIERNAEVAALRAGLDQLGSAARSWEASARTGAEAINTARRSFELEENRLRDGLETTAKDFAETRSKLNAITADNIALQVELRIEREARSRAEAQLEAANGRAKKLDAKIRRLEDSLRRCLAQIAELEAAQAANETELAERARSETHARDDAVRIRQQLDAVLASTTWRMMRPARMFVEFVRRIGKKQQPAQLMAANMAAMGLKDSVESMFSIEPAEEALSAWKALVSSGNSTFANREV